MYIRLNDKKEIIAFSDCQFVGEHIEIPNEELGMTVEEFYEKFVEYVVEDNKLVQKEDHLDTYKKQKEEEFSNKCNERILAGFKYSFNGIMYHFSLDTEAQLNFQGAERLLGQGLVPSIEWTVRTEDGTHTRIPITPPMMQELAMAILTHKNTNIAYFRNELMPKIKSCQTKEEIDLIKWES